MLLILATAIAIVRTTSQRASVSDSTSNEAGQDEPNDSEEFDVRGGRMKYGLPAAALG